MVRNNADQLSDARAGVTDWRGKKGRLRLSNQARRLPMNKVRIKEAATAIKNRMKIAANKFSGNKTNGTVDQKKQSIGASNSVSGKAKNAAKDR
jgi:hypothetical protein